jgi:macrodomain Ter protein organizer (MatP/YcbG family)
VRLWLEAAFSWSNPEEIWRLSPDPLLLSSWGNEHLSPEERSGPLGTASIVASKRKFTEEKQVVRKHKMKFNCIHNSQNVNYNKHHFSH